MLEEKKSDRVETRTEVSRVVVKCINHQAMELVQSMLYLKRTHCQSVSFSTYKHAIKYIVHNSGNDVNVSLDCPTKLGGSSFKIVTLQQIFVIL